MSYPAKVGSSDTKIGMMLRQINAGSEHNPSGSTRATESFPAAVTGAVRIGLVPEQGGAGCPGGVTRCEDAPQLA